MVGRVKRQVEAAVRVQVDELGIAIGGQQHRLGCVRGVGRVPVATTTAQRAPRWGLSSQSGQRCAAARRPRVIDSRST